MTFDSALEELMYARVTMFSTKPATLTPLIATVRDTVLSRVKDYEGFVHAQFVTRSRINKAILTTFWRTEYDAMQAEKDGELDWEMEQIEPYVVGPAVIEGYEVSCIEGGLVPVRPGAEQDENPGAVKSG